MALFLFAVPTSSTTSTRSTHKVVNFASLSPGTLREVEAATKAVDMCVPSILREQDQQAAEKERQRKALELTEVNLLYHLLSGC